jgi:CHAT domain-containing protein
LGNVTPQANPQLLSQLSPEQRQLYQEYQALTRSNDPKLAQFLARPQVQSLARQVRDANLRQLQKDLANLDAKSAVLYPVIRDDRVELILIAPGFPPLRRSSYIPRSELVKHLQDFRYSLEAIYDVEADPKKQGQILYRHLIQPLEDILEAQNIRTLFYAPSAQLRYVPLNALYDGRQWLSERFLINNITSASLQNFAPKPQAPPRMLAAALTQPQILSIGSQTFHFGGLPSARGEVNYLTSLIAPSTKLLDQEFSPANTRQQSQSFNWLHLATHGVFLPGRPEDSFILFGDGQHQNFRALRQWDLANIDLVVLSACETAAGEILGNGEEILGFGYLMQERGARSTIASLWSVSDGGTQAWMEIFYTLLVKQKMTKAEAMAVTQRILITKDFSPLGDQASLIQDRIIARLPQSTIENLDHPYYWAPFLLIGNGF